MKNKEFKSESFKTIQQWLDEYGESHQNQINKLIHYICVPLIYMTTLGLIWSIPFPSEGQFWWLNWASVLSIPMFMYYLYLSKPVAFAIFFYTLGSIAFFTFWQSVMSVSVLQVSIVVFIITWLLQFVGHKIEGKKPSLFKDVQFLAIGPAWIICHLFNKLGVRY